MGNIHLQRLEQSPLPRTMTVTFGASRQQPDRAACRAGSRAARRRRRAPAGDAGGPAGEAARHTAGPEGGERPR